MKKWLKLIATVLIGVIPAFGQIKMGSPVTSTTVTLTVSPIGSGTGNVSTSDNKISLCAVGGGGTCTATYAIGASVSMVPNPLGGSVFAWSNGTDGASVCSGGGTCTFVITANATISAVFSPASGTVQPYPTFSIDPNSATSYPNTINHGGDREWDTPNVQWSFVAACTNGTNACAANAVTYTFTSLDTLLKNALTNSVHFSQYALARTPMFASGDPNNPNCNYYKSATGFGISNGMVVTTSGTTVTITGGSSTFPTDGSWNGRGVIIGTNGSWSRFQVSSVTSASALTLTTSAGSHTNQKFVADSSNSMAVSALAGQCAQPSDITGSGNANGTNLYWRNWVANVATHVNSLSSSIFAHVAAWEIWNEPDTCQFWNDASCAGTGGAASYDQLERMAEDAYFLIKGDASFTYTLTQAATSSGNTTYTGTFPNGANNALKNHHINVTGFVNGANNVSNKVVTSSTTTTVVISNTGVNETHAGQMKVVNTFTGETAAQVQASVTSITVSGPIDTTATISMPSYHPQGVALTKGQNYLYCNASPGSTCTVGGALFTDVINYHDKPGNNSPSTMESVMDTWTSNVAGQLVSPDSLKPFWDTEGGYSAGGFSNGGTCTPGSCLTPPFDNYADPGMEASFMSRFYVYSIFKGWANNVWYNWNPGHGGTGSTSSDTAYTSTYNWLVGGTVPSCSTTSPGTAGTGVFTYTCTFNQADGTASAMIWDNSQYCTNSGATCVTTTQTVSNTYLSWVDLLTGTKTSISSHQVPVGIKPILLEAK